MYINNSEVYDNIQFTRFFTNWAFISWAFTSWAFTSWAMKEAQFAFGLP